MMQLGNLAIVAVNYRFTTMKLPCLQDRERKGTRYRVI